MEIELGGDYKIKSSSACWTLYELKRVQSGQHEGTIKEVPSGDHVTLKTALVRAMDFKLRDVDGSVTLEDVIARIDTAVAEIVAACAHIDAAALFKRDRQSGDADGENDNPDGLYKLPGKIAELVEGLEIVSRNAKGRGETIVVKLDTEEKRREFVATCKEQVKTCPPALKIVYRRALDVVFDERLEAAAQE